MQEKTPSPLTSLGEHSSNAPHGLADFLRQHSEDLVLAWEEALEARYPAGLLHESLLRDYLPGFIELLADALEHPLHHESVDMLQAIPDEHALQRLEAGMEPRQVALEFGLLRYCIHQGLARTGIWANFAELALINESIDQGIIRATSLYMNVRERMLKALECASEVALESQDLDTFLPRLLRVLQEAAASVDRASVLLLEGAEFRLRAAVGLGARQAMKSGIQLPLDEELTGQVATRRGSHFAQMVATHPGLRSDLARQLGLRAVYSVPLRHGERLIGVAYMSSKTLFDFAPSDKLLFRTLMRRATSFIVQAELAERERRARTEAQHLLSLVDTLVEACPVGISLLDRELRFLCINDTLARINGHTVARHLGRTFRDMAPAWVVEVLEPYFRQVLEQGQAVSNHEFTSPLSEPFPQQHWLGHYYPVRTVDGEVDGLGCVVVNITQQKRVEAALRQSSELRERLIGVVGHDLRNPLNAISASATLLRRNEHLGADAQHTVERIRSSAARMARMLNDILDFARSNANGGLPVHRERVNLHELCRGVLEELQVAHADRRLELDTRGNGWGWWDPDRLAQVVSNLVGNALQHGREDTPVRVEVRGEGDGEVFLSVHNEGEPITEELKATLFQPFRHGAQGKATSRSVGLGLYIVRQVAHAHGGEVEVHSNEAGHTLFTVRLPRGP